MCLTDAVCFDGGDLVMAVGILVSAGLAIWSLVRTGGLQEEQNQLAKEQNQLLEEQNEIARRQIEGTVTPPVASGEEPGAAGLPARAKFRVDLRSVTREADRLVVRNVGTQRAAAIQLTMDPDKDLVGGPADRTFPLLAPGEEWRLPFAPSLGSPSRYQWLLTWVEEPDGRPGKQTGWVSQP